jgi:hypothetical protein
VSAIQPSAIARTDHLPTSLGGLWQLEHDVLVRAAEPRDQGLPCLSGGGAQATLEVCGRGLVRGQRSRVVQLAWELVALRARAPKGSLASFGIELIELSAARLSLSPSLAFWLSPYACRLHHAEAFGSADMFALSVGSTLVDLGRETVQLGLGDRIDVYLNKKRPRHAEIALITERL